MRTSLVASGSPTFQSLASRSPMAASSSPPARGEWHARAAPQGRPRPSAPAASPTKASSLLTTLSILSEVSWMSMIARTFVLRAVFAPSTPIMTVRTPASQTCVFSSPVPPCKRRFILAGTATPGRPSATPTAPASSRSLPTVQEARCSSRYLRRRTLS